jgi:mRNA interferase RelE/StbE
MYELIISDKARDQLKNLSQEIINRIGSVFERIKLRPFHFVKRKEGTPYFILRIGEYRAILDIKQDKEIIFVIEIGHRKNIYG